MRPPPRIHSGSLSSIARGNVVVLPAPGGACSTSPVLTCVCACDDKKEMDKKIVFFCV